ncbi:PAS domain S-box-containing protein [Streptomyces sp. Ag82_O1-12]|uniref:SpoIIE family protein phosphatase n=1 Tax=unclassified Streptomyces TaxID=2593676 RepID=UPI000BC9F775|nr:MULTISPECIES: SpoIIE family protein phosphatase [unclassified Streptomyces]SMQ14653.1 PAS domain S-box-containing protein [Streptomyces sp. Ag82_O1-12]SOD43680.1 PAS domain S-box-containing protein [Streptomyces sp. Ag82_G6-1]
MQGRVPEDLAFVVDAGGAITVWSDGARRLLGYEPAELVGRPVDDLLAARLPESTRRHTAEGRPWAGEVALRHRDGNRVVVRLRGTPLLDAEGGRLWLVTGTVPVYPGARGEHGAPPLWDLTLAQLPVPVAVYDRDARLVGANEIMTEVMGRSEEEMKGLTLWEIEPNPPFDTYDRLQREVLRTGEMIFYEEHGKAPGEIRPHAWSMFMSPLKDEAGVVQGMSATVFDTTEQYWARRRLAVLNEASLRIGSTLDVTRTAEEMAEVAVTGGFADFVTVDLLESVARGDEPGPLPTRTPAVVRRTAQRSVLEGCPESVVATGDTIGYPVGTLPLRVLAAARGARHRPGDPELLEWLESSPARAQTVTRYLIHSVMMVPLRARGVTLGLVHFLRHRTPDSFSEDDLLLAEDIVARAAVSVDNARRFTRERRTALALQRSLLPERLPELAAMDIAYRYLPTGTGADIGGDWFDVIPLSGARVALVVGDVVGHGIQASATMGRLRTAVRTLADVDLAPDELLTQLDDLVIRLDREEGPEVRGEQEASGQIGATCLYAVYDPVSRRCTMARAGHPPPALVTPDGSVRFVDLPAGPPLGLGGLPFEAAEVQLEENSLLALYTDGLIEAPGHDIEVGIALLRQALNGPAVTLEETCEQVLSTLLTGRPADDDVVLMLARTAVLDAGQVRTWQLPPDPAAVARARKMAGEQLAEWGLTEAEFATELIVSELVTNALRYGGAPIELRLIRDSTLICEVSDGSSTAPHLRRARVFDEGGRGLLLVAQLAERWGSRQTATGKTIWAEQDLPTGV